jgi:hypothetical protein
MLLLLLLTLLLQLATHWVLLHHAFHVASSTKRAVNVHLRQAAAAAAAGVCL